MRYHRHASGLMLPEDDLPRRLQPLRMGAPQQQLMSYGSTSTVAEAVSIYGSLMAWWSMDDNAANTTVTDSSGNSHTATSAGGFNTSTFSSTTAISNRSMLMTNPGGGSGIYVPRSDTAFDFSGATSFTIGLWFRFGAYSSFAGGSVVPIMGRWNASNFNFGIDNTRDSASPLWRFGVRNSANTAISNATAASSTSPVGNWYFLVGVHDSANSQIRLYVNNVKTTTSGYTGGVYGGNATNFAWFQQFTSNATVDTSRAQTSTHYEEAFVCNAALTDAEVSYLYNSGSGRSYAGMKADAGH